MNIVVAGYDKMLAALISGAKLKGHNILGVFRIDRVKYSKFTLFFKDIFAPSVDYSFIKSHNLYDIKAKSVNSKEFINEIKHLNPDVILVGSWSEKFGAEILNIPKYGIINIRRFCQTIEVQTRISGLFIQAIKKRELPFIKWMKILIQATF